MEKREKKLKLALSSILLLTVIAMGAFTYRNSVEKQKKELQEMENEFAENSKTDDNSVDANVGHADTILDEIPQSTPQVTAVPSTPSPTPTVTPEANETSGQPADEPVLSFSDNSTLVKPVESQQALIDYSMDATVYFPTLNVYKYNPALVLSAVEGEQVHAAADGKVTNIFDHEETGLTVSMDMGNGYTAVYGQLQEVSLQKGDYVSAGDVIGTVCAPTKYYSKEGSNLYFAMSKDGISLDPVMYFPEAKEDE